MKRILKTFVVSFSFAFLFFSCYKDKGNYAYTDINKISITADVADNSSVLLQDTLKINCTLVQTIPSSAGMEYSWTLYQSITAPLVRWDLGTTQNLKSIITQPPGVYTLDYFVKDKATNVSFRKTFTINIIGKFNEGWLVIEENAGACDLNMISPSDAIFKNIYSSANAGSKLPAGSQTINVVKDRLGVQKIYVLAPNELIQPYYVDFLKVATLNDLFWGAPTIKKPQQYYIGGGSNEMMINNGYPHGMNTFVPAPYKFGLQASGTWDVEPYEIYNIGTVFVLYDKLTQRFYKFNLTNMLPFNAPPPTALFNVNKVNKKMLFAGANIGPMYNCLFKNNNDDSLFVYKLDLTKTDPAADTAYISNVNAPGLLTATKFINSRFLPHMYYINGNTIYLLDIAARKARIVYTFPAGTVVTSAKMYLNTKVASDPDNNLLIGIATTEGSVGKVYTFPISVTGNFTGNTYRKVYTGFSKINDIIYKSAP